MIKRILRAGLGVIFFFVFLAFLLVGAMKFRALAPSFWKTSLNEAGVYQLLRSKVVDLKTQLSESARRKVGAQALPRELTTLLSAADKLTEERFRELIETNLDRLSNYFIGKETNLVLFLPVAEWELPVALLGQPALARLSAQTPVEDVLPILGMKPGDVKSMMDSLSQVKTALGYLIPVWIILLLLTVGLLAGHYFLGEGLVNRISGTAWLLLFSGFIAKLIGVGAAGIFEIIATNSKPPMEPWMAELGRSLVGQFFNFGATVGLVVGIAGLVGVVAAIYLAKQGKAKEEKEKLSLKKRVFAFVFGVILGFVVLAGTVAGLVFAFGGTVDFKVSTSSSGS